MPKLDEIYCTDEYPRKGCRLEVTVKDGRFRLQVFPPGRDRRIESYAYVDTPKGIGRMVKEWCDGKAPVLRRESDYLESAPGSDVTM